MDVQIEAYGGRRVAAKRATDGGEAARLRREADLFDVAGHPGLVEVLGFDDGPTAVLRTVYVDGPSLATELALDVDEVAGVVAAVASTLADLHALGVVHGAVAPDHVLLDRDGRPLLCSLGYGGLTGERLPEMPNVPAEFLDPTRAEAEVLDPAFDVFALGALLTVLLARAGSGARGAAAEALRRIASGATAPSPGDRPAAKALADAVHDAVWGARLPKVAAEGRAAEGGVVDGLDVRRRQRPLEGWRRAQAPGPVCPRRRRYGVLAAVAVAAVGGAVAVLGGLPKRPAPSPRPAAPPPVPTTAQTVPVPTSTSTSPPSTVAASPAVRTVPAGCSDVDGPLSADVDGDGCPEALRWLDGVVEAGARRWAVGEPGDVVAVGDWTCAGARALAVLRPRTGDVFAFSSWATATQDVQAPLVARVAGGQGLRAADIDGDGCNELVVERAAGAPAVVSVPRTRR